MAVSKYLVTTEEERETYDYDTKLFSEEVEEKIKDILIDMWNTRVFMSHQRCTAKRQKSNLK